VAAAVRENNERVGHINEATYALKETARQLEELIASFFQAY
jgi:methyl-accepting chemotaxis protein